MQSGDQHHHPSELLARLKRVKPGGPGQWTAACPAHDDRQNSLSVTAAPDRILVKCHAGCGTVDVVKAVHLTLRDLFHSTNGRAVPSAPPVLTLDAFAAAKRLPVDFLTANGAVQDARGLRITYYLADGALAARQRRRTALAAKDGSTWDGPAGAPLVPYGLWRLDEAREKGELLLVEGETDALAAWIHNIPALGIPGASQTKLLTPEVLASIDTLWVVREPDQGGRTFVEGIERRLGELAWTGTARVLTLPVKDIAELHITAGDRFADELDAAQARAVPLPAGPAVDGPVLLNLGDVAPEAVEWLWQDRIARGKLALVVGEPGSGKTYATLDVTARTTTGAVWPDGGAAPSGAVLLLTSEDGLADTVRPIIDRQHGDPRRVSVLRAVRVDGQECSFNLERDLPALEQAIIATAAVVVIISPLSAYLGSRDSYKDAEVRAILSPLAALAEKYRVALVGILHLTKAQQRKLLLRAQGSVAFVAQARTVLVVGEDPETPGRRLLAASKNNLGSEAPALAFRITDAGLAWEATPIDGTADRLLAGDEAPTRTETRERDEASQFLRDLLRDGPVASKQVEADAKANGIAQRTLWRAKNELGIAADRARSHDGRTAGWYWRLPVGTP